MSELNTRKPTGLPPWPILLIAGTEKSGKTYAAAAASASPLVGRTLWVGIGEDDPDEYGAIDGVRFEIVEHDGAYRSILATLDACVAELAGDKTPGLIVLDSGTRLWNLLTDEAQATADKRAAAKAARANRSAPDEAQVTVDLWNVAKQRWDHIIDCLRDHQGPSIVTARLDNTVVMNERGEPTKERVWKVQAHKSLPFDAGAIVELRAPGEAYLTGVRSLRVRDAQVARRPFPGFTVDALWTEMGLADGTTPRVHSNVTGEQSARADETAEAAVSTALAAAQARVQAAWLSRHDGTWDFESMRADYEQHTALPLADATPEDLSRYADHIEEEPA